VVVWRGVKGKGAVVESFILLPVVVGSLWEENCLGNGLLVNSLWDVACSRFRELGLLVLGAVNSIAKFTLSGCQAQPIPRPFGHHLLPMTNILPGRVVRLEDDGWSLRRDGGALDAEESQELCAYLDASEFPNRVHDRQLRITVNIAWEVLDESLSRFYAGRAEVFPF
jgi:hypothetical protein